MSGSGLNSEPPVLKLRNRRYDTQHNDTQYKDRYRVMILKRHYDNTCEDFTNNDFTFNDFTYNIKMSNHIYDFYLQL